MGDMSSGKIANILANDTHRIEVLHYYINYLWVRHWKLEKVSEGRVL